MALKSMQVLLMALLLMSELVNAGEEGDKEYIVLFYDSMPMDRVQINDPKAVKSMGIPREGVVELVDSTRIRHLARRKQYTSTDTAKKGLYHTLFLRPPTDQAPKAIPRAQESKQVLSASESVTKVSIGKVTTWALVEPNYSASFETTRLEEERADNILSALRFVRTHYFFPTININLTKWFNDKKLPDWASKQMVVRGEYSLYYATGSLFKGDSREDVKEGSTGTVANAWVEIKSRESLQSSAALKSSMHSIMQTLRPNYMYILKERKNTKFWISCGALSIKSNVIDAAPRYKLNKVYPSPSLRSVRDSRFHQDNSYSRYHGDTYSRADRYSRRQFKQDFETSRRTKGVDEYKGRYLSSHP